MLEPAVIVLRLAQYGGAMVLLGSSLLFLYALPRTGTASAAGQSWTRGVLLGAALLLSITSLLQIAAQSVLLSASMAEGLKWDTLSAVVSYMPQGKSAVVRALAALAAVLFLLALPPGRARLVMAAGLGAIATVSLAWMGHAAATEGSLGWVHLASDGLHALAAAVWLGALCGFLGLLLTGPTSADAQASLHRGLATFAGVGSATVAVLILTGLVNSWILIGPERVESLWTTPYGRLLAFKLLAFAAMLGLAAANRFRLTPAFGRSLGAVAGSDAERAALRRSIAAETALGLSVLLLVAWFGTLAPPAAA